MLRLRTALALSGEQVAVAIASREDDDPTSTVARYDGSTWSKHRVPGLVTSLASLPAPEGGSPTLLALSEDGTVWSIADEVTHESIFRDPSLAETSVMTCIRRAGRTLVACGWNGRAYLRSGDTPWEPLPVTHDASLATTHWSALAIADDPSSIALVGHGEQVYRTPTADERAELEAARASGDRRLRRELRARYRRMLAPPGGRAVVASGETWLLAPIEATGKLEAVGCLGTAGFLAVGGLGTVIHFGTDVPPSRHTLPTGEQQLLDVTHDHGRTYVLARTAVVAFDDDLAGAEPLELPPAANAPMGIGAVDGVLWLFDAQGTIARRVDRGWEPITPPSP